MKRVVSLFATMSLTMICAYPLVGYTEESDPNEVVASVDGVTFLRKDLNKAVNTTLTKENTIENRIAERRKALEDLFVKRFVRITLYENEAKKEGVSVTEEDWKKRAEAVEDMHEFKIRGWTLDKYFKAFNLGEEVARKDFEIEILRKKLIEEKVPARIQIDDAEVETYIKVIGEMRDRSAEITDGKQHPPPMPTANEVRGFLKEQKMNDASKIYLYEIQDKAKIETIVPIQEDFLY